VRDSKGDLVETLGVWSDTTSFLYAPRMIQFRAMENENSSRGERRTVTILFTDIVGSTTLAEKLDPEEWKEIVNGAHRRVSEAVTRYEGTVAQLLGDGVLAFFGAPVAHEDDPARAVRAGLDMQRAMFEYARELRGYVDNFQMRVGINTGQVVVGAVGSAEHSEYLAVGDAVNLAARLQSAAQPGTVLISEMTARFVQAVFDLNDLGEISVKGKAEPVRVFQALEQRAPFSSGRGMAGLTSPLVGRAREFGLLQNALEALREGRGQIVAVLGEPGIGKSRLVEEARIAYGESPIAKADSAIRDTRFAIRFLEGRALSYGQSLSFWIITQLLQNDLGVADGEAEIKIKIALRRRMKNLFGDKADEVLPYLAHLLGLKLEGDAAERVKILDGETLKRQALISIGDYFAKLAEQQPTVLVFEDVHWADPSSLDALERLLRVTRRAPLLLVLLTRRETDKPAWRMIELAAREYRERYTEIELEPLSAEDSQQLVSNLLSVADLPEGLRALILERAEGNPLYVEEIVRELMERGVIEQRRDDSGNRLLWRVKREIREIEIPETLQGVLLARIDRLQEDVKRTLQLASVIGRSFLYKLLEAISEAERELDWHVSQLERADLVREKTRLPELEYMFKHSLTQEAAYESLLHERRKEFHKRVGEAIEKLAAERHAELLGLLAYHFDRAGDKAKAIDYLIRAGDRMRLSDAHVEAIQFYERARDLLIEIGDLERAAKTWLKLGLIHHANFEFEKAHEANEAAFALEQNSRKQRQRAPSVNLGEGAAPHVFRFSSPLERYFSLDPGRAKYIWEGDVISNVFAGLAELDAELNVVPHVARSWEVLEGGTRYVLHLREDVFWTDGNQVTAMDFEWAWKRNLALSSLAELFDEIKGARDFRQGRNNDLSEVGVRALDALTYEVRLVKPVAYFPYLLTRTITYPLPRAVVEQYGDEWWKPEHIVSNGAFQLREFDKERVVLQRNPTYFGEFSGNLNRIERWNTASAAEQLQDYLKDRVEVCDITRRDGLNLNEFVSQAEQYSCSELGLASLVLPPHPPLDDVRVRRALIHALDRERVSQVFSGAESRAARGGMVPPGIAGHSPEIGLAFDIDLAQRLLAQAGYPNGRGCSAVIVTNEVSNFLTENEIARQWQEHLGIEVSVQMTDVHSPDVESQIRVDGWVADYPDPDNFLRNPTAYMELRRAGWQNQRFVDLVETAASITNRAKRMALYREADRIWISEDVVICPLKYFDELGKIHLTKPWVKNYNLNRLGDVLYKHVRMEGH